jgi:hypothetical protein
MRPELTSTRVKAAWVVALAVDALQLGLGATTGGFSSFVDAPLDIVTMIILWRLVGWHWVLLPSFALEFLPFVEFAPTWTLAVLVVTRGSQGVVPSPGGAPAEPGEKPPPKVVEAVVIEPEIVDPPAGSGPAR